MVEFAHGKAIAGHSLFAACRMADETTADIDHSDLATLAIAQKIAADRSERDRRFKRFVSEWGQQRNEYSSDPQELAMCPAYQKIIAMGPEAIPLILNELKCRPDHWFWALNMLTDTNPIRAEHAGNFNEMVNDWLVWGRENGYLRD